MKKYDALVAAGTTEAKEAIACLQKLGMKVAATVATKLGADVLCALKKSGADVYVGRRDAKQFKAFMEASQVRYVVDATHPFAVDVTQALKDAVAMMEQNLCVPRYIRYVRRNMTYTYDKITYVKDAGAAAKLLQKMPGNFLLTTGANTVHIYKALIPDFNTRGYVRVLNTEESLAKCRDCGISNSHVIANNPPFSAADNFACIRSLNISVLVSKDSGKSGGMTEKIESAEAAGIQVILIERPLDENGVSTEEELKIKVENFEKEQIKLEWRG